MLNVTSKNDGNEIIVFVEGRVDSSNAGELGEKIKATGATDNLTIDLEKTEYISSAGLRIFLNLKKTIKKFKIINASTDVYDLFEMTGFTEIMEVKRAYRRISIDGAEVIGQGANGKVYRTSPDTVVKVYINPDSLSDIEHERAMARKALVLGLPTAISYDVVKVNDSYASMFEMINAKSLAKSLIANSSSENITACAKVAAELLRLIHSTEATDNELPNQREITIGWIKFLENHLPCDTYNKLFKLINEIPEDKHIIHGDYHIKNIMLQDDEPILIDMDTLAIGAPILELGSVFNAYKGYSLSDHNVVLNFLGISYETATEFLEKLISFYLGTTDAEKIQSVIEKAAVIGFVRAMRRTIRRNGNPAEIEAYKNELIRLSEKLDTLAF